jgi:hypothetical protein
MLCVPMRRKKAPNVNHIDLCPSVAYSAIVFNFSGAIFTTPLSLAVVGFGVRFLTANGRQ